LNVDTFSQSNTLNLRIAAFLDWFPSWYPLVLTQQRDGTEVIKEEPLFVGNLEYLFEQAGGDYPHSVWLKTLPNANYQEIVAGVQRLRLGVEEWRAPMLTIEAEQLRPERQGLFGLLSIGFLITTLMTVIGFFYYTVFYFRYRQVELGTLQAIGLPSKKVMAVVTFELVFVILIAVTSGTVLGIIASRLFIPALLVNQWTDMPAPPYQVDIAWETILNVYILFFLLLLISLVGLMFMLRRVKLFEALKMGETQ
jgi:putative ABC transport system permease protein